MLFLLGGVHETEEAEAVEEEAVEEEAEEFENCKLFWFSYYFFYILLVCLYRVMAVLVGVVVEEGIGEY